MKIKLTRLNSTGYREMIIDAISALTEGSGIIRIHTTKGNAAVMGVFHISESSGPEITFDHIKKDDGIGICNL